MSKTTRAPVKGRASRPITADSWLRAWMMSIFSRRTVRITRSVPAMMSTILAKAGSPRLVRFRFPVRGHRAFEREQPHLRPGPRDSPEVRKNLSLHERLVQAEVADVKCPHFARDKCRHAMAAERQFDAGALRDSVHAWNMSTVHR